MASQAAAKEYRWTMPRAWWTRRSNYFWYMVREFTSVPLALWLLWFLVEISRERNGPAGYHPHSSVGFVIFSIVCLAFALYHSVTFLSLAGAILHFRVADKPIPSRLIVLSQFGLWAIASVVIGFALVYLAQ